MFVTESVVTPLASRYLSSFSLVLVSLVLLAAGKLFQLCIRDLFLFRAALTVATSTSSSASF